MGFSLGFLSGTLIMLVLHSFAIGSYKRVLIMKSKSGIAECIDGKFYYIKEEGK